MVWSIEEAIERQHGLVARWQLIEAGMSRRAIEHRLAKGVLVPMRRGVYAVGRPAKGRQAAWMAAVLAAGPGAVLSHRAAGAAWGMRVGGPIEVTAPGQRRVAGVVVHQSRLPVDERTTLDGIPITTPARTLLDLAGVVDRHRLRRAFEEAEYQRLTSPVGVPELQRRHPRRPGAAHLRELLADRTIGDDVAESELEAAFAAFLAANALPKPVRHVEVEGYRPDAVWPEQRLVVELDGHQAHATASRFESDRVRDRRLQMAGWTVVRVTWRMLHRDPSALARDLAPLLRS